MKGKRHSTDQNIRILREADGGKNIVEVCKEHSNAQQAPPPQRRPARSQTTASTKTLYRIGAQLRSRLAPPPQQPASPQLWSDLHGKTRCPVNQRFWDVAHVD